MVANLLTGPVCSSGGGSPQAALDGSGCCGGSMPAFAGLCCVCACMVGVHGERQNISLVCTQEGNAQREGFGAPPTSGVPNPRANPPVDTAWASQWPTRQLKNCPDGRWERRPRQRASA